jgi:hypothetical protein
MKKFLAAGLLIAAAGVQGATSNYRNALVATASNADNNQLLVYDVIGDLIQTVPTQGKGGVSGNSGGIATDGRMLAVVNYNSQNVSIFTQQGGAFQVSQLVPAASNPVSVAFGNGHLYILGTTKIESHELFRSHVNTNPDGVVPLMLADGSAAQVGILPGQLIITEKNSVIETVALRDDGAATGTATLVSNLPNPANAPFGLVTRGDNAYVTIAHSNEISLVRNGKVLTTTGSGTEMAPCWVTLSGPFLYSANSPSKSVSRYAVYGQTIVQDTARAATFSGSPTDIASLGTLLAVIDGSGSTSHISIFDIDEDGNLTMKGTTGINAAANGVAIINTSRY